MIKIGITQRVDEVHSYKERRDSLDQKWSNLFDGIEMLPIPLPNLDVSMVRQFVDSIDLQGIVLSGGNSLACLEPLNKFNAPERDAFEMELLKVAIERSMPVLGVCRGMQFINYYFKGGFEKVEDHVGTKHEIYSLDNSISLPTKVNSFHNWGIPIGKLGKGLIGLAIDDEGNVGSFKARRT